MSYAINVNTKGDSTSDFCSELREVLIGLFADRAEGTRFVDVLETMAQDAVTEALGRMALGNVEALQNAKAGADLVVDVLAEIVRQLLVAHGVPRPEDVLAVCRGIIEIAALKRAIEFLERLDQDRLA